MGNTWLKDKPLDVVLNQFRRAEYFTPNDPLVYFGLGKTYEKMNDTSQAIAAYEKSLALGRVNLSAHVILARLYRQQGNLALAQEHARAAKQGLPTCAP